MFGPYAGGFEFEPFAVWRCVNRGDTGGGGGDGEDGVFVGVEAGWLVARDHDVGFGDTRRIAGACGGAWVWSLAGENPPYGILEGAKETA